MSAARAVFIAPPRLVVIASTPFCASASAVASLSHVHTVNAYPAAFTAATSSAVYVAEWRMSTPVALHAWMREIRSAPVYVPPLSRSHAS